MLQTLSKVKREAMEHPAQSADLVPSDFHLFLDHLKKLREGEGFNMTRT
jgi:hypothetical protein